MKIALPILALVLAGTELFVVKPIHAQQTESAKRATKVKILEGPSPELVRDNWAIVTWTSNNPGGSDEHFGFVQYGKNPSDLNQTAKSHIRLNQQHPQTVFRVRITGLEPRTTYYYKVDSMEADGTRDGIKSPVKQFTTQ
jgi:hypothetical protein